MARFVRSGFGGAVPIALTRWAENRAAWRNSVVQKREQPSPRPKKL